MKILHGFYIATTNFGYTGSGEVFKMGGKVKFFRSPQNQIYPLNTGNFLGLQLGIASGNHHKALGSLPADAANQLSAFFVGIIGYRTGIDYINVGFLLKRAFHKSFQFNHTGKGGGF